MRAKGALYFLCVLRAESFSSDPHVFRNYAYTVLGSDRGESAMSYLRILVAVLAAGPISMFSDWLFMCVLFHESYNRYPEVWWPGLRDKAGDRRAIAISSGLGYLTAFAVV